MLYPGQITYGFAPISKKLLDNLSQLSLYPARSDKSFSLAQFAITRIAESHVHMLQTLRMFESNIDNERDGKPNTLKQAIRHPD